MNNQFAVPWYPLGNNGQALPVLGQPSHTAQPGRITVPVGPYRSYAQVVRDYLTGNDPLPPQSFPHRMPSYQPVARHAVSTGNTATSSTATPVAGTDEAVRGLSRLQAAEGGNRPGPTWSNVSMDMVAIYIEGEDGVIDGTPFNVHKAFFTHLSPYFDAAFNSTFAESSTQTLHFAESSREIFALLVQWVYVKDLTTLTTFEVADRKNLPGGIGLSNLQGEQLYEYIRKSQELALAHTKKLIDLWFLADKVLMPDLKNAAIQAIEMIRFFTPIQGVPAEVSNAVYDKTPKGSPIRKYFADTTLRRLHPQSDDQGEEFHPDMLIDMFNIVKITGANSRLRHYGLSEKAMEAFLVETNGNSHLKANPNTYPPLADDVWVGFWELRRDRMKFT